MTLTSTSKETPEREASYSQTRSVYSSIYTCTYERVSSASTSTFANEITSSRVCSYECGQVRVFVLVLACLSCCSSAVVS